MFYKLLHFINKTIALTDILPFSWLSFFFGIFFLASTEKATSTIRKRKTRLSMLPGTERKHYYILWKQSNNHHIKAQVKADLYYVLKISQFLQKCSYVCKFWNLKRFPKQPWAKNKVFMTTVHLESMQWLYTKIRWHALTSLKNINEAFYPSLFYR